jgi:hypothetical protein
MAVECDTSHKKKETHDDDDDTIDLCLEDNTKRILTTLDWNFDTTTSGRIQRAHQHNDPRQDERQQTQRPKQRLDAQEDVQRRQEEGLTLRSGTGGRTLIEIQQEVKATQEGREEQQEPQQKSRYGSLKVNTTKSQGTGTQTDTNSNRRYNGDEEQHQETGGTQPAAGTKHQSGDAGRPRAQECAAAEKTDLAGAGDRRDRHDLRVRNAREATLTRPGGAAAATDQGTAGLRSQDRPWSKATAGAGHPTRQHQHQRSGTAGITLRQASTGAGADPAGGLVGVTAVKHSFNKANTLTEQKQGHDPYG